MSTRTYRSRAADADSAAAQADADASSSPPQPCRKCGNATEWKTLALLGGQCSRCCRAYCAAARPPRVEVPASAIPADAGGRAWAYRLRWRHQQGHDLTHGQIAAYRAALAPRAGFSDEGEA